MSEALHEVLRELTEGGRHDSQGAFSVNWRKAREKLQKFQLTDPHRWVAHAVAAAVASGATAVEVRTDADDCVLSWQGEPFRREQLENLFAYLLSELPDDPTGRLRELALALNAAAALNPARLQLRSHELQLELRGTEIQVAALSPPLPRTELAVRERASWKVVRQYFSQAATPEMAVLRQACRQAPVRLNGVDLHEPWKPEASVTIEAGEGVRVEPGRLHLSYPPSGCRGAAMALSSRGASPSGTVRVLRYGVLVCEKEVELPGHRTEVRVDAPRLPLNVSQSDVLEDEAWGALLVWLRSLARLALTRLAEQPELDPELLRLAAGRELRANTDSPDWSDFRRALAGAPIWRDHAGKPVSLQRALEDAALTATLWTTSSLWDEPPLGGQHVLQDHPALRQIFPHTENAFAILQEARVASERRRAWEEATPGPARLGDEYYLLRVPLPNGELGFRDDPNRPPSLLCFKSGRALGTVQGDLPLPGGLDLALSQDGLEMDPTWTHPVRNEAWDSMLETLENELEDAYAALGDRSPAHTFRFLLRRFERGDASPLAPELEAVPLFSRLDGVRLSLAELRALPVVPFLSEPPPAELREEVESALLVSSEEWAVLAHFLGEGELEDMAAVLEPIVREREFMERPPLQLALPAQPLALLELEEGYLALEGRPAFGTRFSVEALFRGRLLERLSLEPPAIGSVVGRIEVEGRARPNPRWNKVGRGRADLVNWLEDRLVELALRYGAAHPNAPGLLELVCGVLAPHAEQLAESENPVVRACCALPLLSGPLSLDELIERLRQGDPPELLQREKLLLTKIISRTALEPKATENEPSRPGELPPMPEGYEWSGPLPEPWKGQLGLTRRKSSRILVPDRKPSVKRVPVAFVASLTEAPPGVDWHKRLLAAIEEVALRRAEESPDYLFFLLERGMGDRLADISVRGDVLGRAYALKDLLAGPVEFMRPEQKAPASHPQGPLYRLSPEEAKSWGKALALVEFRPPLATLDEMFPGREWLVRLPLEGPFEGELGVPLEGEAGEVRIEGPGGWIRRPLPHHRGVLGVVRGSVDELEARLPLEQLESMLAACPRDDEAFHRRVRGWRDWRTLGLGLAPSPLASLPCLEEGTSEPDLVEEPPMSDYERLSAALREQMGRILRGDPELSKAIPTSITFAVTPKGTFCQCTPDGRVTLNPSHPLLQRLLEAPSPEDEHFYFLVSAVFSVINRARADIRDDHEREFHARLLAHLLKEDA